MEIKSTCWVQVGVPARGAVSMHRTEQEAAVTSVAGLLVEAARIAKSGAQIVIATSEDLVTVKSFLTNVDRQLLVFERRLIDKIATDA